MADIISKEKRSYIMSRIRGRDTKPELLVKGMVDGRLLKHQPKGVYGNPDFANKRRRIAVFVDGCFWHGCPSCFREPKSNRKFWIPKIRRNKEKDREVNRHLRRGGWKVVRVWEHQLMANPKKCVMLISSLFN